jgi:hypothetical protein
VSSLGRAPAPTLAWETHWVGWGEWLILFILMLTTCHLLSLCLGHG